MTLTGLQCAIVIKELAEYLDRDAHDVLRTGLEPCAQEGLAVIGRDDIAHDEFAVRTVANWMARVPSAAGWTHRAERRSTDSRTTETRIPREFFQLGLDAHAIARLTQFMAERTQRDSTTERLITARQRRRNINSQTRQMVKPLDMAWLDGHLDRALPPWRQEEIIDTANRLSTQPISEPTEIERWRDEVPRFRTDFISADAAESPRHRDSSGGGATARTYRASWTKFWRDNNLVRVLIQLMYEDSVVAEVERMLAEDDGSELHMRVPIRRPRFDEVLRFPVLSTSYRGSSLTSESSLSEPRFSSLEESKPTSDEPLDSQGLRVTSRDAHPRNADIAVASATATSSFTSVDKVRFAFYPEGKPGDGFNRTWPNLDAANAEISSFIEKSLLIALPSQSWDFMITLQTTSGEVTTGLSSQSLEELKREASRLMSQVHLLT